MSSSRFLLLAALSCCVRGLDLNVAQSSYQAEENQNLTLDWTFTPKPDPSLDSLLVFCNLNRQTEKVLFYFQDGLEIPLEDEEFSGRVWCDKDFLKEGRIRLHVSWLRVNDSGVYSCEVHTESDTATDECYLSVTAATSASGGFTPEPREGDDGDIWILVVFFGLLLIVCVVVWVRSRETGLGTSVNLASCVLGQVCC